MFKNMKNLQNFLSMFIFDRHYNCDKQQKDQILKSFQRLENTNAFFYPNSPRFRYFKNLNTWKIQKKNMIHEKKA